MVYRPSVRYADSYEKYVEEVNKTTHLDRNQIIRLALFLSGHSQEYQSILKEYLKPGASLPQPCWGRDDDGLWRFQNYTPKPKQQQKPVNKETIKIVNKGAIRYVPNGYSPTDTSVTTLHN